MNSELKENVITYWMEKATEALASARSEQYYERRLFAVNRAYYACFYAASAVLMKTGKTFRKHTGVRAHIHQDLVKTGLIEASWGNFTILSLKTDKELIIRS